MKKYTNKILIGTGILIVLFFCLTAFIIIKLEQNFKSYETYEDIENVEEVDDESLEEYFQ